MENGYLGPQSGAVLDIGGEVGAVLVFTGSALSGREIELFDIDGRPVMHTEVHDRTVPSGTVHAGLFPAVPAGSYLLVTEPGAARFSVVVRGGQVTEVTEVTDMTDMTEVTDVRRSAEAVLPAKS
jgi:hypothetical protein